MCLKATGYLDTGETDSSWYRYTFDTEAIDGNLDIRDTAFGKFIPKEIEIVVNLPEGIGIQTKEQ